ncbi:MAG: spore coat associated protein CotJA [Clostridia bacterium]|nr:spore coat associated protein CotJA [Clostridia bacterium]
MNYNEEFRTPRDRVAGNVRVTGNSCGCHMRNQKTMPPACNTSPSCTCPGNAVRITREQTSSCPNTICTTVPVAEGCVDTYPVAMAYVPMQQWRDLYDPMSALVHGTIFRELDLPWYPTNCNKECRR